MDSNQLFWATGINNGGLRTDAQQAEEIFRKLSVNVNKHLDSIIQKYKELQNTSKVKFENPVDPQMISSIKAQIGELSKVIDAEINKLGKFTATYDQSMQKIKTATAKISSGGRGGGKNSPLTPMVEGIKEDVRKADKELSFLARRFQYMWGSMLAYGSISVLKSLGSDIIRVKQQFEQLGIAINSFVGNAEVGNKILGELTAWAVKSPLQILDITDAAKQMLAYGDAADTVVGSVKMLGDIAAGSGQSVKDLAYLYGTSQTQGRLMLRDLYQFGNRGIPIYSALGDVLGKNTAEIMKMTSAGKIGFPELKKALESLTAAGGQYYNLSEKIAASTSGQISNLKDKWTMVMKDIGEEQDGVINAGVQGITTLISHWKELGEAIVVVGTALGSYQIAKMFVGWTAEANLATVATTKLKTVTTALFTAIKAHPYAAAFVAVSSLVAIMWALRDSTTAAEKAQKNLKTALDKTQAWADSMNKRFGDNLDKIKNKSLDGTIEQAKAYQDMETTFGKVLTKQELLNLKNADSVTLQNKVAKAVNYSTLSREKETIAMAKAALAAEELKKKEAYSVVQKQSPNISYEQFSKSYEKNSESLKQARLEYSGAVKQYNDDLALYNKSKINAETAATIRNEKYWENQKKNAETELSLMDISQKGSKEWKKQEQLRDAAQKQLDAWNTKQKQTNNTKAKITTQDRLDAILRDTEKIKDAETKANIELADANLASLDDGYARQKQQEDIKHQERLLAIKKRGEDLLVLQNKMMVNDFLAKNPKGTPPPDATVLNAANQAIINTATEAAQKEYSAATTKLLKDKLLEYGDYATERLEIERKYNADIAALEAERTTTNAASIDSAIRQANVEKSKALMAQSFKKLKESPEFAMAFEDLGNVSTETLNKLMGELNKYQQTAAGTMKLSDFKEYASVIENITDQLIERNPFKVLKESQEDMIQAQEELKSAQDWLTTVKATMAGIGSDANFAENQEALAQATDDVAKAQDNVNKTYNKGKKARKEIIADTQELMDKFSSIGDAMGGQAGEIVSYIGQIGSFAVSTMDAISVVSNTTDTAISAVEKASVILGIISAAISIGTKIADMISENKLAKHEEVLKRLENKINDLSDAYNRLSDAEERAQGADKFQYTDDKIKSLKEQINTYDELIAAEYKRAKAKKESDDAWIWTFEKIHDEAWYRDDEKVKQWEKDRADAAEKLALLYPDLVEGIVGTADSLATELSDAMFDAFANGEDAAEAWGKKVDEIVGGIVKNMIVASYITPKIKDIVDKYSESWKDASGNFDTERFNKTADDFGSALKSVGEDWEPIIDLLNKYYPDVKGGDESNVNSTKSAIQSMSQESADILTAQFSAMRINIDKIRVEMGGIGGNINLMNINVKDILLSLQSQASSLQIVFNDVSRIARNTDRLEAIEGTLNRMLTNGVKVL